MDEIREREEDLDYVRRGLGGDLDVMLVFNIMRTSGYLTPFLESDLRESKLTAAQCNTLLILRREMPQGLRMGDLGRRLIVTKSNVTGLVDRLEKRGLVIRVADADRRATWIQLTEKGSKLLDSITPSHVRCSMELVDCLTVEEKSSLITLLTKLRRELRTRWRARREELS